MESAPSLIATSIAALTLPLLAQRIRTPAVVLEILFGMLVGQSVLGLLQDSVLLDQLALLGFFLLMFLAGFEIDVGLIVRQGRRALVPALSIFAATLVIAYVATQGLGYHTFLIFVLATTSVGLVVPSLRSARHTSTALGQSVLLAALVADLLTLIGVTFFAFFHEHGAGIELTGVPIFLVVVAIAAALLHRVAWWFPQAFERLFQLDDPDELGIRASFALMLIFVGFAELLGIEAILGAFLSGAVFAFVFRERGALERKLTGFSYGFLIPIFFINVGMRLDASVLIDPSVVTGDLLPLLLIAAAAKLVPAMLLMLRGLSLRESVAAGVLLSARLSLIIAVADLGVRLEVIDATLESVIVALAVISSLVAPVAFRLLAPSLPTPQRDDRGTVGALGVSRSREPE